MMVMIASSALGPLPPARGAAGDRRVGNAVLPLTAGDLTRRAILARKRWEVRMAVVELEVQLREPYRGGAAFGATGAYERIDGVLRLAVPRDHPANALITDLGLAPYDLEGRVRFSADLCLLRPAEPQRGNRRLLLELPNRGRKLVPGMFNRAASANPPTAAIAPGDGFLMRHGWTLGWIGWQWDVVRSEALMGLEAPQAIIDGHPARGRVIVRFQPSHAHTTHLLADRVHQPYPALDLNEAEATLTVRTHDTDPGQVVPRAAWQFASDLSGALTPDPNHVYLVSGFEPGLIYELVYTTANAPVVGCGLLAIRDGATFLKHGTAAGNPLAGSIDYVYGFGMSQTGRMLRHFLSLGLNLDEAGRQVFDGLLPHVGGARRGEFNQRFGQPSVQYTPGVGQLPPFDDHGLLARQRTLGGLPKVMQTNSSAEYWRGDCALLHIDTDGAHDLEPEPDTRIYHFAGTQHGPGAVPLTRDNPNDGSRGRYGFNCVNYTPLLRAALVNLDRWVTEDVAPPPSAHPRLADGTAVTRAAALDAMPALPDLVRPDPTQLFAAYRLDPGPEAERGIVSVPVELGPAYPALVAALDADGNELGGLRLPDLSVPVGTHTGWNPRDPSTGAPEQITSMQGATFFFTPDAATRAVNGDPRPSLAERYPTRGAYLERVRAAAHDLARQGYVLEEDIDVIVNDNAARYDEALRSSAQ
jgi:hypothetical protein